MLQVNVPAASARMIASQSSLNPLLLCCNGILEECSCSVNNRIDQPWLSREYIVNNLVISNEHSYLEHTYSFWSTVNNLDKWQSRSATGE